MNKIIWIVFLFAQVCLGIENQGHKWPSPKVVLRKELVVNKMYQDAKLGKLRSWVPTSLPGQRSSEFYKWVGEKSFSPKVNIYASNFSASCFEIVLLYAYMTGAIDKEWLSKAVKSLETEVNSASKNKVLIWQKSWISILTNPNYKIELYLRGPKDPESLKSYISFMSDVEAKNYSELNENRANQDRIFPRKGDIVFFNPFSNKPEMQFKSFDHVAIATGNKISVGKNFEAEILSFYGNSRNSETPIKITTIERMLDADSLIKRTPIEGGDRVVFFATPAWEN